MRILIIGNKGFIGSFLEKELNKRHIVHGFDIGQDINVFDLFQFDSLINAFGLNDKVEVGSSSVSALDYYAVNCLQLDTKCRWFLDRNPSASVINISSLYASVSPRLGGMHLSNNYKKDIHYGASKAAVEQITRQLAVEYAPKARVNCVRLGGVINGQNEEFIKAYSNQVPLGRMANLNDIVGVVEFLAGAGSAYITGQSISVDGGYGII